MKDIKAKVEQVLKKLEIQSMSKKELGTDYMDLFLSLRLRKDIKNIKEWEALEEHRKKNKSISNKIGEFHEMMVATYSGWERVEDLKKEEKIKYKTVDVINRTKKIACEIKNKHNTTNSGSLKSVIRHLKEFKEKTRWKKIYLVIMLPKPNGTLAKKGEEIKECTLDNGEKYTVNYMSGQKLYKIITGKENFYRNLITKIFPDILCFKKNEKQKVEELYDEIYGKRENV